MVPEVFIEVVAVNIGVFAGPLGHFGEVHDAEGVLCRTWVEPEKDLPSRQLVNSPFLRIVGWLPSAQLCELGFIEMLKGIP